jgi:hypothetical protein
MDTYDVSLLECREHGHVWIHSDTVAMVCLVGIDQHQKHLVIPFE